MVRCVFLTLMATAVAFAVGHGVTDWYSLGGQPGSEVTFEVVQADFDHLVLDVQVPGFFMYDYPAAGMVFHKIEIPGSYCIGQIGLPDLPSPVTLFALPFGSQPEVTVEDIELASFAGVDVIPMQEPDIDMSHAPFPFRIADGYYEQGGPYPDTWALVDNEGNWSGASVARLVVNPFRFDASTQELLVARSMRISIDFNSSDLASFTVSAPHQAMMRPMLINYRAFESAFQPSGSRDMAEYIVLCNADNIDEVAPLFELHNDLGYKVVVETLSNPATVSAIKAAINDNYETGVTRFALIVGDETAMPPYDYGGFLSDFYFALIVGGDNYPDIAVGRLTGSAAQVTTQVDKLMDGYLAYPSFDDGNTTGITPSETVLCAHEEQYPGKYTECCDSIAAYDYSLCDITFFKLYPPEGATADDLEDIINNEVGTVGYRGHGDVTYWAWSPGWNSSNINSLTNTYMPPVFNIACYCGRFQQGTCLAESWAWHTAGCSGNLAANNPSYTVANHDYMKQIYIALYDTGLFAVGEAINAATEYVIDNHGTYGLSNARMYFWFGDPGQEIWTFDTAGEPSVLAISGPGWVNPGPQDITVTVTEDGSPTSGIAVTLNDGVDGYDANTVYEEGTTNASGQYTFSVTVPSSGTLTVGAFKHDTEFDRLDIPITVGVEEGESGVFDSFFLGMPTPNPVTVTATIQFSLAQPGNTELAVFDMVGRRVDTISSGEIAAGSYEVTWQPGNLSNGVYFVRLISGSETMTRQVMLVR